MKRQTISFFLIFGIILFVLTSAYPVLASGISPAEQNAGSLPVDARAPSQPLAATRYTLTVQVAGQGSVSKNPSQSSYTYGQKVTLTPKPSTGWVFSSWSGACTGSGSCVVTMNANKTVTATFVKKTVTLTLKVVGSGSITASIPAPYYYGDVVTLTAVPAPGWGFSGWSGAVTGKTNPLTVTMNANKTLTATFKQLSYSLSISVVGSGTVTLSKAAPYYYGDVVTLTALPAAGWVFSAWSGDITGAANPATLTIDGNKTVTATFSPVEYTLTINTQGEGTVATDRPGPYHAGDQVTLTAEPAPGWAFSAWSGDLTGGANPVTITMDGSKVITAAFAQNQYTLDISITGSGLVTRQPDQAAYSSGQTVILTAAADPGWTFVRWDGSLNGAQNPISIVMDGNKAISATFDQQELPLVINITGSGTVSLDPPGPYTLGQVVTLTAQPGAASEFTGWSGDLTGAANPAAITMDGPKTVNAAFEQVTQDVHIPQNLILNPGTLREDFDSLSSWSVYGSPAGYSVTVDNSTYQQGSGAVKFTPLANGYAQITKTVNWNLSPANERGNMRLWVYVYGPDEPLDFAIMLSNDSTFSSYFVTWYNQAYQFPNRPGWNLINIRTSDWNAYGGSWDSPIVRIRLRFNNKVNNSYAVDALTTGVVASPAVLFTFDDSMSSLYSEAYSFMSARSVRGTSYNVTDWVGGPTQVTWDQLIEMYNAGWTIGSHTKSHQNLSQLSLEEQEAQLLGARLDLQAHGLIDVDYVGYPYGQYNADTLLAMANLGMRSGRTLNRYTLVSPVANPYELSQRSINTGVSLDTAKSWVDTAIDQQEILILTLHGIKGTPAEGDWYIDWFRCLIEYCIQQGIPILTMQDLYQLQSGAITIPAPLLP